MKNKEIMTKLKFLIPLILFSLGLVSSVSNGVAETVDSSADKLRTTETSEKKATEKDNKIDRYEIRKNYDRQVDDLKSEGFKPNDGSALLTIPTKEQNREEVTFFIGKWNEEKKRPNTLEENFDTKGEVSLELQVNMTDEKNSRRVMSVFGENNSDLGISYTDSETNEVVPFTYKKDLVKVFVNKEDKQSPKIALLAMNEEETYVLKGIFQGNAETDEVEASYQLSGAKNSVEETTLQYGRELTNDILEDSKKSTILKHSIWSDGLTVTNEDIESKAKYTSELKFKEPLVEENNFSFRVLQNELFDYSSYETINQSSTAEDEYADSIDLISQLEASDFESKKETTISFSVSLASELKEPEPFHFDYGDWDPTVTPKDYVKQSVFKGIELESAETSQLQQFLVFNNVRQEDYIKGRKYEGPIYTLQNMINGDEGRTQRSILTPLGTGLTNTESNVGNPVETTAMQFPRIISYPKGNRNKNGAFSYSTDGQTGDASSNYSGITLIAHDSDGQIKWWPTYETQQDSGSARQRNQAKMTHLYTDSFKNPKKMIAYGYFLLGEGGTSEKGRTIQVPMRVTFQGTNGRGRSELGISFKMPKELAGLELKMGYSVHIDVGGAHDYSQIPIKSLGANDGLYFEGDVDKHKYYVAFHTNPRNEMLTGAEGFRTFSMGRATSNEYTEDYNPNLYTGSKPNIWERPSYSYNAYYSMYWGNQINPDIKMGKIKRGEVFTKYKTKDAPTENDKRKKQVLTGEYESLTGDALSDRDRKLSHPGWFYYYPSKKLGSGEVANYGLDFDVTDTPILGYDSLEVVNKTVDWKVSKKNTKFEVDYLLPLSQSEENSETYINSLDLILDIDPAISWKNSDFTVKIGNNTPTYTLKRNNNKLIVSIPRSELKNFKNNQMLSINQISSIDWENEQLKTKVSKDKKAFEFEVKTQNSWDFRDGSYRSQEENSIHKDTISSAYQATFDDKINTTTAVPSGSTASNFKASNFFGTQPKNIDFNWDIVTTEYNQDPVFTNNGTASIDIISSSFGTKKNVKGKFIVGEKIEYPPMKISSIIKKKDGYTNPIRMIFSASYTQDIPKFDLSNSTAASLNLKIDLKNGLLASKPSEIRTSDFKLKNNSRNLVEGADYQVAKSGTVITFVFNKDYLEKQPGRITLEQETRLAYLDKDNNVKFSSSNMYTDFATAKIYYQPNIVDGPSARFIFPITVENNWSVTSGGNVTTGKQEKKEEDEGSIDTSNLFNVLAYNSPALGYNQPVKIKENGISTREFGKENTKDVTYYGPDDFLRLVDQEYSIRPSDGNIVNRPIERKEKVTFDKLKHVNFDWDTLKVTFGKMPDFKADKKGNYVVRLTSEKFGLFSTYSVPYEVVSEVDMQVRHIDKAGNPIKIIDMNNLPEDSKELKAVTLSNGMVKIDSKLSDALSKVKTDYVGYTQVGKPEIKTKSGALLTENDLVPADDLVVTYKYDGQVLMKGTEAVDFGNNKLSIFKKYEPGTIKNSDISSMKIVNTETNSNQWKLSAEETKPMRYRQEDSGDKLEGTLYFDTKTTDKPVPLNAGPKILSNKLFGEEDKIIETIPLIPNKNLKKTGLYLDIYPGNKVGNYGNGEITWSLTNAP